MGFLTDSIHAGQHPEEMTGAVIIPIYQTSTYANEGLGISKGFDYGRTINPTRSALEANIASLEKGKFGIAFSSGMAAIQSVSGLLNAGEHVICSNNVYGGTYRFFEKVMRRYDVEFTWVNTSDSANITGAIKKNTKMVYIETPTNPMLQLTDMAEVSNISKKHGLISVADNTFMSPYFQNPLEFGIDIVLHSTTKYINGHSDVIGGIVVTNNSDYHEQLRFVQNAIGAVPSPFDCWLVLRSTKTLGLRMRQHNKNAMSIAEFLEGNPKVNKVYYPGLAEHPHHELAKKQMSGFGGMITIDLGSVDNAREMLKHVKIFQLAESLGGVESLISHPVSMTHGSIPKEERERSGLTDGIVRLSVGCEDEEDLIADLNNALSKVTA